MRHLLALCATAVLAGGCQIVSYTWVTPVAVPAGRVFTMEVTGTVTNVTGQAGVVFQVPVGFTVLGASTASSGASLATATILERDVPTLLATYTPDPGHYLVSFSGTCLDMASPFSTRLKVYVQAPVTAGSHQFEMALACFISPGWWAPQLGLNSFQTPGGSVVRPLQVSASPAPPPFALHAALFDTDPLTVRDVEAADVDRDGRDDLVVLDTVPGPTNTLNNTLTVRRSIPGAFALGSPLPIGTSVWDSAVADFDGDGFVDVALSSGTVLFGNGGAAWTPVVAVANPTGVAVGAGDVDGDGLADLAWGSAQALAVVLGQANRTFLPWSNGLPATASGASSQGLQLVDLDADGRAELVACRLGAGSPPPRVYRSTAAGVWSLVGSLPPSFAVLAIDADGNGTKELLVSNGNVFTYTLPGLIATGGVPVAAFTRAVALDFDRDGRDDIALGIGGPPYGPGSPPLRMQLWRNTGGGFQPAPLPPGTGFEVLRDFFALVAADFDDDTFPDLAASLDKLLVWHNTQQGVAPFGEPCAVPAAPAPDLSVQGSVAPGQPATLQLGNAGPQALTLLWLGTSRRLWNGLPVLPLDLGVVGAPGCTLLAEPLAIVGVIANGAGVASLPFTVPPFAPTVEVTMFAQGAVLAPTANALGVVFSRGLALKIQ